jgi:hypothetical protein
MRKLLGMWVLVVAAAGTAAASPDDADHLQILTAGAACAVRDGLCLRPRDATTLAPGAPTASLRTTAPALGLTRPAGATDETPWTMEVSARLARQAFTGNALFILYDAADAPAIAAHETTALYQATIAAGLPGSTLHARLALSPNDGFRAGHEYLLRIAQLIDGREVLLAQGTLRLQ